MIVVALLLIVYVAMKPESGPLSFSSVKTPEKFVSFQGQIELTKGYRDERGNKFSQQFVGAWCISPGCSLVCHLNNPRGSALGLNRGKAVHA